MGFKGGGRIKGASEEGGKGEELDHREGLDSASRSGAHPSPPNRLVILNGLSAGAALIISRRLFSSETAEPLF